MYDSIERGSVDEVERRRPRTFTLTQLLVACVAVCVCVIAATTVVKTHRALVRRRSPPRWALRAAQEGGFRAGRLL